MLGWLRRLREMWQGSGWGPESAATGGKVSPPPPPSPSRSPSAQPDPAFPPGGGPSPSPSGPPTLPTGLTPQQYLESQIWDRCRRLEESLPERGPARDHRLLLSQIREAPTAAIRRPPLAARRLLYETRRPNVSFARLALIVERDPALVQALLKHANSPWYASPLAPGPIASVPVALRKVGARGVETVVMGHLVEGSLCRPGEGLDRMAESVWSHMVRVAPLARGLAAGFDVDPEEAYALGLLHDVGKLVLFARVSDLRRELRRSLRLDPPFLREALRHLHEPLGGLALLQWGLGEEAALAVAHHHLQPPLSPPSPRAELLFVAEKTDLARQGGEAIPAPEGFWARGLISTPLSQVAPCWQRAVAAGACPAV